jgi:DNA-binding MarR family transcriptional regulator
LETVNAIENKLEIPGFIIERTAKRMKQFFQQKLSAANADITVDQWVILQMLEKEEGISQLEIAKATFKDPPTVTRIIDLLCKKNLTRRVSDSEDRRRFRIFLTPAGRHKIEEVMPIIEATRETAWQGLENKEMDALVRTLNTVFDNLR